MIGLVDCNNFFVSCERLFRPDLEKRPVAVLSSNDGCVVSRCNQVKALGFRMGEPYFKCRARMAAAGVKVFSSNFELYGDMSARVAAFLNQCMPEIEIYSIDELFVDLSGIAHARLYKLLAGYGAALKQGVGIPASFSAAATKTLAKAANRYVKRNPGHEAVLVLTTEKQRRSVLAETPVGSVWGIGRGLKPRLEARGIENALQLADMNLRTARRMMGVLGEGIVRELNGECCWPLGRPHPQRKTIIHSRSFGRKINDAADLAAALRQFTARAAAKLRKLGLLAAGVHFYVSAGRHARVRYDNRVAVHFPSPTCDTFEMLDAATGAAASLWRPNCALRNAGLILFDLTAADSVQSDLFQNPAANTRSKLLDAIERVNSRYGRDAVSFGSPARDAKWQSKRKMTSMRATTCIAEVAVAS